MCLCYYYDWRIGWDVHVEHCALCRQVKCKWNLVKIVLSAIVSLLYPLVWLSLSFLQTDYYVCAHAGPRSEFEKYCDRPGQWWFFRDWEEYEKEYNLAFIRSKVIGSVLFLGTLFFLGLFLILYGQITNHLKKMESSLRGTIGAHPLQVHVAVVPGGPSSEALDTGRRPSETAETEAQVGDVRFIVASIL